MKKAKQLRGRKKKERKKQKLKLICTLLHHDDIIKQRSTFRSEPHAAQAAPEEVDESNMDSTLSGKYCIDKHTLRPVGWWKTEMLQVIQEKATRQTGEKNHEGGETAVKTRKTFAVRQEIIFKIAS